MINNFSFEQLVFTPLIDREIDVLILLSQGLSNYDISQKLFLSTVTIDGYYKDLLSKLFMDWCGHCRSKATKRVRAKLIWDNHKNEIIQFSKEKGLIK